MRRVHDRTGKEMETFEPVVCIERGGTKGEIIIKKMAGSSNRAINNLTEY